MTYHPGPLRAYESHCADAYLVEDDETTAQEPTGGAVSDVPRDQAPGGGGGLREAVEALAGEWEAGADAHEGTHPLEAKNTRFCVRDLRAVLATNDLYRELEAEETK